MMLVAKALALLLSLLGFAELGARYTQHTSAAVAVQNYARHLSFADAPKQHGDSSAPLTLGPTPSGEAEAEEPQGGLDGHHQERHHGHHSHKSGKSGKSGHSGKSGKSGHSNSGHSNKSGHSGKSGHPEGRHHGRFSEEGFTSFAGMTPQSFSSEMLAVSACHGRCGGDAACHAQCPKPWQPMYEACASAAPALQCHRGCRRSRGGRECHQACPEPPAASKLAPVLQKTHTCHMSCAPGDRRCHHRCPHSGRVQRMCAFVTGAVDCHKACTHGDRECHHSCPKVRELWGGAERGDLHI